MGKPRMILLIRHAQSEGNKNREVHQMIPDHRVKLTDEGRLQAEDAGCRLRALLKPDDTLQIYTSPYRRTRETTEGILKTLTARYDPDDPDADASSPSPFSRTKIKVYEEPRIREQDFGNFQPNGGEMERMWRERADYGHFFYRIPNGESAADAYDRISGFNESLWRQFGEADFPSVCVLVTHGLMTRVFLMKWYHWSVEYFEDLRNINHCEFIVMRKREESGKFVLENQLRTWSELKRQRQIEAEAKAEVQEKKGGAGEGRSVIVDPQRRNTLTAFLRDASPVVSPKSRRKGEEGIPEVELPARAQQVPTSTTTPGSISSALDGSAELRAAAMPVASVPLRQPPATTTTTSHPQPPRGDGTNTPHEMSDEETENYFADRKSGALARVLGRRTRPQRKATEQDIERWTKESGMGEGRKADALGDEPGGEDDEEGPLVEAQGVREEAAEAEEKSVAGNVY
ncbi:hypothetical protein LTR78_006843 [Recurvomyces mirabilis]|uniref:Phosphoglycerate mutase-like protein n=1 Tax=Recurvomyces mirabilis TaxID=574656 RepID=A0AAE1BZE0_9PEZI|nr:hypothetical protein LTR78_006843 [Recurvomyces mirabilis]KAK5153166.1 hypothetical protein LTS14_007811 [Recurvomyces mirabilis]